MVGWDSCEREREREREICILLLISHTCTGLGRMLGDGWLGKHLGTTIELIMHAAEVVSAYMLSLVLT
jgi:hypothetical protein